MDGIPLTSFQKTTCLLWAFSVKVLFKIRQTVSVWSNLWKKSIVATRHRPMMTGCDPPHCRTCWNFDPRCASMNHDSPPRPYRVDPDGYSTVTLICKLQDFQGTKELGCRSCESVCTAVESFFPDTINAQSVLGLKLYYGRAALVMEWDQALDQVQIFRTFRPNGDFGMLGTFVEVPNAAGSEKTSEFIKEKFEHCVSAHSSCREWQGRNPTRLLYIGQCASDLRLVEPNCTNALEWAALSYCWGGYQAFRLGKANLSRMMRSIAWKELPNLHRDAVTICRLLGLDYLWIDVRLLLTFYGCNETHTTLGALHHSGRRARLDKGSRNYGRRVRRRCRRYLRLIGIKYSRVFA